MQRYKELKIYFACTYCMKALKMHHYIISHLVTRLSTSRQQAVFALLVTSCQQVWNKLLTTCKQP